MARNHPFGHRIRHGTLDGLAVILGLALAVPFFLALTAPFVMVP